MRERPILFNGPMVRAILAGHKTQTRRVVKNPPAGDLCGTKWTLGYPASQHAVWAGFGNPEDPHYVRCPFGKPGDRLWVRESWQFEINALCAAQDSNGPFVYAADGDRAGRRIDDRWRPSIHMPRWACRLVLEITAVRVERLQAITEADALAEGSMEWAGEQNTPIRDLDTGDERIAFAALWDSTGGTWDSNPWLWVIEFKLLEVAHG